MHTSFIDEIKEIIKEKIKSCRADNGPLRYPRNNILEPAMYIVYANALLPIRKIRTYIHKQILINRVCCSFAINRSCGTQSKAFDKSIRTPQTTLLLLSKCYLHASRRHVENCILSYMLKHAEKCNCS